MEQQRKRKPLTGQESLVEVAERLASAYLEDGTQVVHYDVDANMGDGKRVMIHFLAVARPVKDGSDPLQHTPI